MFLNDKLIAVHILNKPVSETIGYWLSTIYRNLYFSIVAVILNIYFGVIAGDKVSIDKMRKQVQNFCEERDWDQYHNPKDLAIGLSTESNELLDLFRFKTEEQMLEMMQDVKKRERISEELSDVFFFLLRFSQMYDFDLEKGLQEKIQKNNAKYPVELVKGNNQKYNEYTK